MPYPVSQAIADASVLDEEMRTAFMAGYRVALSEVLEAYGVDSGLDVPVPELVAFFQSVQINSNIALLEQVYGN